MNFTREPIVETIVTPKEGYKLLLRNTKGVNQEEFNVDAVEVVSFGSALFYRSLEKRCFLLPILDYEIVEVRETKILLKNIQLEKNIKIAGGKESFSRASRETEKSGDSQDDLKATPSAEGAGKEQEGRSDRNKRDRRRNRRRKPTEEKGTRTESADHPVPPLAAPDGAVEGGGTKDETVLAVSSSMFSSLIPPPATLISETLNRSREKDAALLARDLPPRQIEEGALLPRSSEEEPPAP